MRCTTGSCLVCFARDGFFFFNDTATTEIYTLSLHDALPISERCGRARGSRGCVRKRRNGSRRQGREQRVEDRKSTRLNSSHGYISYAVFCLKKKKREVRHSSVLCVFTRRHVNVVAAIVRNTL